MRAFYGHKCLIISNEFNRNCYLTTRRLERLEITTALFSGGKKSVRHFCQMTHNQRLTRNFRKHIFVGFM